MVKEAVFSKVYFNRVSENVTFSVFNVALLDTMVSHKIAPFVGGHYPVGQFDLILLSLITWPTE